MEQSNWKETAGEIIGYLRHIVRSGVEYTQLELAERISRLSAMFLFILVFLLLFGIIMVFLGISLAFVFADQFRNLATGFFIVTAIYLFVAILLYLLRDKLILNPILRSVLKILTDDHRKDQ